MTPLMWCITHTNSTRPKRCLYTKRNWSYHCEKENWKKKRGPKEGDQKGAASSEEGWAACRGNHGGQNRTAILQASGNV